MIFSYGVTQQGAYHAENNIVCQDAHLFRRLGDGFAIGAVADGLGSELYTDVASKTAVETSVSYCEEKLSEMNLCDESDETILEVIKSSFEAALDRIKEIAKESGREMDQYDTTLVLAVFGGGKVYFGNSGDSGMIILQSDGLYESPTNMQRDEYGCVFPLIFGEDMWEFGCRENVASVLIATDGMLETFFPILLRNESVEIYVQLAEFMMNGESLGGIGIKKGDDMAEKSDEIRGEMERFMSQISSEQVSDDKTVLLMLDTCIDVARQPEEYYERRDWNALKKKREEEYRIAAYPHLFGGAGTDEEATDDLM